MSISEDSLGKRRRSLDPPTTTSQSHRIDDYSQQMRSKRRYSCPEATTRIEMSARDLLFSPTQQKISMIKVFGQLSHSSRVTALREEKMQEIQTLCVPQAIKKVRSFWQSNPGAVQADCTQTDSPKVIKRSCSAESTNENSNNNKKYKPHVYPKPTLSKQCTTLSRQHSLPTMTHNLNLNPETSEVNLNEQRSSLNSSHSNSPTKPNSPELGTSPRNVPPELRIDEDDSPSASAHNAPADKFAAGRLSPVSIGSPMPRRRSSNSDSLLQMRGRLWNPENFNDFIDDVVNNVLGSVFVDSRQLMRISSDAQPTPDFEEDRYLNNLISTSFIDVTQPEEMSVGEEKLSPEEDLDSFADTIVSQVLNDFFSEQSLEQHKRQEIHQRRKSTNKDPSFSPELLSKKDRYKAKRCKPVVPAETWRIRRQRSFGHELSDSEPDIPPDVLYLDLDTTSLDQMSSDDVMFSSDVINYAEQLSDDIIEEVFKMLSFQHDEEDDSSPDDDNDDDTDDSDPGGNDRVESDDNDSDKGESVPDYEDIYEFADEYVTNIISSVITEVSMTTDSGVEELCEEEINLDVLARYIVEDAISEALNIVRKDQPTSPVYGQLIVRDDICHCVRSRDSLMTSRDSLMTSRDSLMMSRGTLRTSAETVFCDKNCPKYGTLIILDDLKKDPLEHVAERKENTRVCTRQCTRENILTRQNSNSLPSLKSIPTPGADFRAKSCNDLTVHPDPVLRNLTQLCESLGVDDMSSAMALDALRRAGSTAALFDQQFIDILKSGSNLKVPGHSPLRRSQYVAMSPVPPYIPPRSSTEAIYENNLDTVIKHAREEQRMKKRKKREISTRRKMWRPVTSSAKQKSFRRTRRNLRLIRRASTKRKKVVEYNSEKCPPTLPSSYCNIPSATHTFFVAHNNVPKYLSEISYENMTPKDVLKPTSITMKRYASFSLKRDISPFVRAEYEGMKKAGSDRGPEGDDKGDDNGDEDYDIYKDLENEEDQLPVIVPTNVSVEESKELSELYGDDDELDMSHRPLPNPTPPRPKCSSGHYYQPTEAAEGDEENHFYDDISDYHRACDKEIIKNGYETVGGEPEIDYTGIDDSSELESEVSESLSGYDEIPESGEVDVSDLQVEEVELNDDLYGDDYSELPKSEHYTVDPLTTALTTALTHLPSPPANLLTPADSNPAASTSSRSSLRTSSLHLYDNQLPELRDHDYYNLTRRSHSISTGSSSLPREHDSFHSAMSYHSFFSSSGSRSSSTKSCNKPALPHRVSPVTSHYDTPPQRKHAASYENLDTRKQMIQSWHGTHQQPSSSSSPGLYPGLHGHHLRLSRDLKTTSSQPALLSTLPPYNLCRGASSSPFTSVSDNNVFYNNDISSCHLSSCHSNHLSSCHSNEEFVDDEGYEVPIDSAAHNSECDKEEEDAASSPEHCYELIGDDTNPLYQDTDNHLYEFISDHMDHEVKPILAPIVLQTTGNASDSEFYEDVEVSTPSYKTETPYETLEGNWETSNEAGVATPETPTVAFGEMWDKSQSGSHSGVDVTESASTSGIGDTSLMTSSEHVMTSSSDLVTSSPEVLRKAASVDGSLSRMSGDSASGSSTKSMLRRISLGKPEYQLTSEEFMRLKRAPFVPPPPPKELECHRPRSGVVSSPVQKMRANSRSLSIHSDISSSGQTDDKESDAGSADSHPESDIEEENGETSTYDNLSLIIGEALWDHLPLSKDHLEFKAGDLIEVLQQNGKWWRGRTDSGKIGWFPADSVRLRISQEADESEYQTQAPARRMTILQRMSTMASKPKLNPDWVRQKVIEEIINYEEGYVKNLKDVIEGPLKEARLRKDLFNDQQIKRLFSNIEELFDFQVEFLESLKQRLKSIVHKSEIGDTFTEHQDKFVDIYSRYCNNHSCALAEYTILNQHMVYTIFFESCRLLKDMESIPLDGYLLKPVQRICQYQLQLKELVKYTSTLHPDHSKVKEAESIMSRVASTVNERKRRTENINKLAQWQSSIEDWRGEDILVKSSILIHSGNLYKISAGNKQLRKFFLFDKQLVYCRKLIGSGKLQYKGRLNLDQCQTLNLEDNSEAGVVNGWKMDNPAKNKWIILFCKKNSDKVAWLNALKDERRQVELDKQNNFNIPEALRRAAYVQVTRNGSAKARKQNSFSLKYKSTSNLKGSLLVDDLTRESKVKSDKKSKGFSNKMFLKKQKKVLHLHD